MGFKQISRRQFIGKSIAGGLGTGFAWNLASARGSGSENGSNIEGVSLEVGGDTRHGYHVTILFHGQPVAYHNGKGEFSAFFQNGDRSLVDRIVDWRAQSWTGDATHVKLRGECQLPNLSESKETKPVKTTVFAEVEYKVVSPHVVRKEIRFHQTDMFMLFYQVSNRLEPVGEPQKFWSFGQPECRGRSLHEYYPAAGFRTDAGLTVGLLTDSGFRNQWSRMVRTDGNPVKPAPRKVPDVNLYQVPGPAERAKGKLYVQQTFGEALQQIGDSDSGEAVALPPVSLWTKRGEVTLEEKQGVKHLAAQSSKDGVVIPFNMKEGEIYSVGLEYKSQSAFALDVWTADEQLRMLENLTLYNDRVPASPQEWSTFQTTVLAFSALGQKGALFISVPQSEQALSLPAKGKPNQVEIRNLKVRRLNSRNEPYHRLEMGRLEKKTVFIFVDDKTPDTQRGYRLSSELHLADGLGAGGNATEKVLYADVTMLSWIAGPETFRPMIAPSIWYSSAGEMYLRDSFFAANGVYNCELNEGVFNMWADNQGANGAINTLIEPNMANLERKSNDSTPLWLIWALQNRRRFGTRLPMDKVRKAAEYCLRTYDRFHNGICWAQFVMGQLDVIDYPKGTTDICENQGMLAVTLRVIKELNIPGISRHISDQYIEKVEKGYQSYYDTSRKFVRPARNISDAVGFGAIFPEFLSLWLFDHKMLTDEMIVHHLNRIPVMLPRPDAPYPESGGTVRPILIGLTEAGKGWSYFTDKWHPMVSNSFAASYANHNMDGIYYNGGSWMRIEVCGYATGKMHGWSPADKAIANRLWAEINISRPFPTSQEYLATDPAHPFFGYHRVFAWNVFALQALEVAKLRRPEMDPDYRKRSRQG